MSQEESKYSFGRQSYNPASQSSHPLNTRLIKGTSEQYKEKSRLSQGGSRQPGYSNFTEDDIGDEGITELFNYLSDSESETSKRHSLAVRRYFLFLITYCFRFNSQMKPLEEEQKSIGNETGTFPFGRESDDATFARASKERSIPRTQEEGWLYEGEGMA